MALGSLDPRTPVLIGAGQLSNRVDRGEPPLAPTALMAEAARRAAEDTGAGAGLLSGLDGVRVVSLLSWRYRDPALAVAQLLGASPRDTAVTSMGGNSPQSLVNVTGLEIQRGEIDLVLLCGAEAWRTRMGARSAGAQLDWARQGDDVAPARVIGDELTMSAPAELARGIAMPVQVYPLFEQALRIGLGRTQAEHRTAIAELWARFNQVAASNPHAWIQRSCTAEEIRTPTAENRMVGWPYTKLMNSNNAVEQAAAVLLCSAERADALGVPRDRWVFPHAGSDAHDHELVSERHDLRSSPAIRLAGRAALDLAGVGVDDLAHVDVYSCFPSAVQVAATELGLGSGVGDDRPLTVTGGLSFAGGPWNDYVMHAIATMAGLLREEPGSLGLVTANGGYLTKHAFGVYGTEPPAAGFRHADVQDEVDALPRRAACEEPDGEATIESWTVMHDRDGAPETAIVAALLPDGRRAWATSNDADVLALLVSEDPADDPAGRTVKLHPDGALDL